MSSTDPTPSSPSLRASDAERERYVSGLRRHMVDGRLTLDEFSQRTGEAYAARTRPELDAVLRELPPLPPAPAEERPRQRPAAWQAFIAEAVRPYVLVNALLIAVWALAGGGFFWPVWPLLGWGLGVVSQGREVLRTGVMPERRHGCGSARRLAAAGGPRGHA
ncbi:DUF1707 domain-containing protein [soil metagenome]|jgi:hypothetical protein